MLPKRSGTQRDRFSNAAELADRKKFFPLAWPKANEMAPVFFGGSNGSEFEIGPTAVVGSDGL